VRGFERLRYPQKHSIWVAQYVVVPKSQDAVAGLGEKCCPSTIRFAVSVLPTICFQDQSCLLAHKVGNVRPDRLLTPKLEALNLP
jgi:hypothetical protein